ncbi:threonine--tRNA ligase [Methylogaea oryzae]|uniref:Threonine--tRNA ligase n=1 Tax=Methylogaea oryzae TaxID=1295382 RepID=A0A8D4VRH4_9GAMM|nr:threonine--tRNA ligase [Methylogaea oryzae]BBL72501.1 threonine--tRNA ligase [Methylogaea oryzae]
MPVVTLPDGSQRQFDQAVTVMQVAESIGAGLARAALAGRIDGKLVDTSTLIERDAVLAIVTAKDADGLEIIRHSTAHLLAQAVKSLFPSAQVTIGPVIEDGFYYDFSFERPFTPEDLAAIEKKMQELAGQALAVQRKVLPRDEAAAYFLGLGEKYKAEIIGAIPAGEDVSLYSQGEFTDLCRGPHVPDTGKLKTFKLMKVAGAYWRGDSRNEMLQRIYGTAWADKKDLDAYLHRLEEAERRDHRKIGKVQDLFHTQEEAPGMVFWHPKGWTVWQVVEQHMRGVYRQNGYQEIRCPQILDVSLWKASGHWDNFHDNMFFTASENREYAVKPMNCPGHIQVFKQHLHSYRELPIRFGEFGSCHRNEPSGALHGIMRVRSFTQDDGHIFCTEEQVQGEVAAFIELLRKVYVDFGFTDILYKLSTRPEKRLGSDEVWDKAESALAAALASQDIEYQLQPGEGAFYGPKIECSLRDAIGRVWQCGTIQVDFMMPGRLGAEYVAEDSSRRTPVMLHRAIVGSFERFIGILIEHHAGSLPTWLAPIQAVVANITDRQSEYVSQVAGILEKQGFRVKTDLRNEKIGFKIREHSMQRVPYLLVVGDREMENGTVAVRSQQGTDLGSFPVSEFAARLAREIEAKN